MSLSFVHGGSLQMTVTSDDHNFNAHLFPQKHSAGEFPEKSCNVLVYKYTARSHEE